MVTTPVRRITMEPREFFEVAFEGWLDTLR
jgi:hypothetical protein